MTDDLQPLGVLRSSASLLRAVVEPLADAQLQLPAYPTEWTVADLLSHLGSGAVILQRRLDDALVDGLTPDDFQSGVWDEWNSKSPRQKADDALAADVSLVDRLESLSPEEREGLHVSMGPLDLDFRAFAAIRLNEHVLHSWDIGVAFDPAATLPADAATLVVDNLELVARYTAKPTGESRTVDITTTVPERRFAIDLSPDSVTMTSGEVGSTANLRLPAEAFARLVYGRLDPQHTPAVEGDAAVLDVLRRVFPGP